MDLLVSMILSGILAGYAFYKNAFTKWGTLTAFLLSVVIAFCGGLVPFLLLLITFVGTLVAGKLSTSEKKNIEENIIQKTGTRDVVQVLCNVFVGAVTLVIYRISNEPFWLMIYAAVMASSFADSMASEIGMLSSEQPFDIRTWKKGTPGISGGVTKSGLIASLFASAIIAFIATIGYDSLFLFLLITTVGFLGAFFDSVFGAFFQVHYACLKCQKETEKKIHCNLKTIYQRGIPFINNDVVNLCNNLFALILQILFGFIFHLWCI